MRVEKEEYHTIFLGGKTGFEEEDKKNGTGSRKETGY